MDKPQHIQMQMDDSIPRAISELKLSAANESSIRGSESYAAWKEKQFPHQMDKSKESPNGYHKLVSSTHNNSNLQNSQNYLKPQKSCDSPNCHDYNCKSQLNNNISPNNSKDMHRAKLIEDIVNKYSSKEIGHNQKHDHHMYSDQQHRVHYLDNRMYTGERNHPALSQTIDACDIGYRQQMYRSQSNPIVDAYAHRSMDYDYHSRSLQPMHFNQESHHHSCTGCTSRQNNTMETETVKHMLQIISSQNEQIKFQNEQMKNQNEQLKSQDEQIKNLQKQIERLIKLHEQSLKSWKHCTCQPSNGLLYQNAQMYAQNNYIKDNERGYSDMKENEKSKQQAFLEQKVSIGVMTSFELKVQNNQSVGKDKKEVQQHKNNYEKILPSIPQTSNILKNLVNDTGEMLRKQPTSFNPHALENISEGSESHLSSFRQNNLCSDTRQSPEVYEVTESQNGYQDKHNGNEQTNLDTRYNINGYRNQNKEVFRNDKERKSSAGERIQSQTRRQEHHTEQYNCNSPYNDTCEMPQVNEQLFNEPCSSPNRENRQSPMQNYRSEPYGENRSSPVGEHLLSPHLNKHNSPYDSDQRLRHEDRLSPYGDNRGSLYSDVNGDNYEDLGEEPLMSNYKKMKNPRRGELPDDCLSLSSSEVDIDEQSPPSPERSIFLEMPEYSSESGSLPPQRHAKPGWTMCDNVLYQVNQILQNSSPANNDSEDDQSDNNSNNRKNHYKINPIINQVQAATFEQLAKMGLSYCDSIDQRDPNYNKK